MDKATFRAELDRIAANTAKLAELRERRHELTDRLGGLQRQVEDAKRRRLEAARVHARARVVARALPLAARRARVRRLGFDADHAAATLHALEAAHEHAIAEARSIDDRLAAIPDPAHARRLAFERRRQALIREDPEVAGALEDIARAKLGLDEEMATLDRALHYGKRAETRANNAVAGLGGSKTAGLADVWIGEHVLTHWKRSNVHLARQQFDLMNDELKAMCEHVAGIDQAARLPDLAHGMMDYAFDNMLTDLMIQDRIESMLMHAEGTRSKIRHVLERIEGHRSALRAKVKQLESREEALILG